LLSSLYRPRRAMKFEQEMAREWPRISNPEGELLASRQARSVPSGGRGPGDALLRA
jgi:hypothetical protein